MKLPRRQRKGASALEFTLVGIPIIFTAISFFQISMAMWVYQGMSYAVREGTRYASMHGYDCGSPNTCTVAISDIATVIKSAGPGFTPGSLQMTFTPASGSATSETLTAALTDSTTWPPSGANAVGNNVTISLRYPVSLIWALVWPGAGNVADSGKIYLNASSTQPIVY